MSYSNFTSLPPDEESTFVVYEARTQESAKLAMKTGIIVSVVVFVITILVVFSHDKPKNLMADDDMGQLASEKERATSREALKEVTPPPAPAAPSEADGAEPSAPAEPAPSEVADEEDE